VPVVYRFHAWDITNDCYRDSRRWATKEAIQSVMGKAISDGVEVDDRFLGHEVDGMTERGFDPHHPPSSDFPNYVR
jgi:hypothetical protein